MEELLPLPDRLIAAAQERNSMCPVCVHDHGDHYRTYDGNWSGCSECTYCQGCACANHLAYTDE